MNTPQGYPLGHQMWHKGESVQITSAPYELFGGWFQDAVDKNDQTYQVVPEAEAERLSVQNRDEWRQQQEGFRRLERRAK